MTESPQQVRTRNNTNPTKSNFVPQDQTEARFTEWLLVPLKERRLFKRSRTSLHICVNNEVGEYMQSTHSTNKALKVPLPSKRFNSPHTIPNALLASLAFRRPKPNMTRLTVRMPTEHCEAHLVAIFVQCKIKGTVAFDAYLIGSRL